MEQLTAFGSSGSLIGRLAWGLAAILAGAALVPGDSAAASRKAPPRRAAQKAPQCPSAGTRSASFGKALDGSSFLTADGVEVRLAGVLAPGAGGEPVSSPQADSARRALAGLLGTGALTLAADPGAKDRYGRVLAQVFANGVWVQGALLRRGEIRAAPDRIAAPCTTLLMAAESEARTGRAGHWRDGLFSLRTPEQIANRAGTFQIVEGTVVTATLYKGRAYINFGADYRTDFTVTVAPEDMKIFRQARFDVKKLAGQRIRVRGWVELYNGPEMEIATPGAIEAIN